MIQPSVPLSALPLHTLDYVLETLPSGVILLDSDHRIVSTNAKGRVYLARLSPQQIGERLTQLGQHALSTLLPLATTDSQSHHLQHEGTPPATYTVTARTLPMPNERSRWLLVLQESSPPHKSVQPLRQHVLRRQAHRQRLQSALRASRKAPQPPVPSSVPSIPEPIHLHAQLTELKLVNAQLARAVRLKDQFWSNMGHELRTPLSAILLNGELLQRNLYGTLTPKQTQYVQRMMDSTNHLLTLINDILDLTRTDAGYVELTLANGNIRQFCLNCLEIIKEQAHHKQIGVSFDWDEQAATLRVDEQRFKQILVNLLSNAVKFTPEKGKIGLKVTADPLTGAVYFAVWDTGHGIAATDLPQLFQRFVRIDAGTSSATRGTGLGLALVVQLTRLHGGQLDVSSTPGSGSCFTVSLPWTPPIGISEAAPAAPLSLAVRTPSFVQQLSSAAHELTSALVEQNSSLMVAQQAIDLADQIQQLAPDLIFLDLTISDAEGWRQLPAVVQAAKQQGAPVIVLDDRNALAYAQQLGAAWSLSHPLTRTQIQTALATVLPQGRFLRTALLLLPKMTSKPLARILIVEDVGLTGTALTDYLFAMGYDVAIATTHGAALTLAQKRQPHLVLLDLQLPGIDSLVMVQQLRALPGLADLPVMALTALSLPGDTERLQAAGVNGYVSQPFQWEKLLATIEQLLPQHSER